MSALIQKYHPYLRDKDFLKSAALTILLLIGSLVLNFYLGAYADKQASSPVTDIVLSNIRRFNVSHIFIYGAIAFWVFVGALCLADPKKIPFTFKTVSLFIIVRSICISLTHIGEFSIESTMQFSTMFERLTFGGGLFFSGHTGLPFLMALIFWRDKPLRWFFVGASLLFGTVVLLGHIHYSIDVFAAFFITHSIYRIAEIWLKKDRRTFYDGTISPPPIP